LTDEAPDLDDYNWPEPEDGDEDDDPLFDSTRGYVEQIERYREYQGKEANPVVWTKRCFSRTCEVCGNSFEATRPDATACSMNCRSKRWRKANPQFDPNASRKRRNANG
jgi:hypothetical protein